MPKQEASVSDNEPRFYHPHTPNTNKRLQYPLYMRFERNHPRFFTFEQKVHALERQGYTCPMCGESIDTHGSECHHMVQWQAGGASSLDNLVVVHEGRCHHQADALSVANGDMIIGGTIWQAEPTQVRDASMLASAKLLINRLHNGSR